MRQCLQLDKEVRAVYDRPKTMYRHQQLIREWLQVEPYYGNLKARRLAAGTALRVALMIDDPVDIVNAMLGELQRQRIELPAYSTLDRFAAGREAAKQRGVQFGRPPKLTSDQKQLALRLLNEGKSAQEIAGVFHVHSATIYRLALADS